MRESAFWRRTRVEWQQWKGGPNGQPQMWPLRIENIALAGFPDLIAMDTRKPIAAFLELKSTVWPSRWPRTPLTIDWRPGQVEILGHLARVRHYAGALIGFPEREWLFLPAQPTVEWLVAMKAGNGFLTQPHVLGQGPVPIPPLLFALPADGRRVVCAGPPDVPRERSAEQYVSWPFRLNGTGMVTVNATKGLRQLREKFAREHGTFSPLDSEGYG